MTKLTCGASELTRTIEALRAGGERSEERVVLWLAPVAARGPIHVTDVYEPEQITGADYFRLLPQGLRALMAHLRARRLRVVAQVHSHPGEAYHSEVDDERAIIRHAGALSLVLPDFARGTTPANFVDQAATYELSAGSEWVRVPGFGPASRIEVLP